MSNAHRDDLDVQLDALPYHDKELETTPGLQQRAAAEIQRELASAPKLGLTLPPDADDFLSAHPLLHAELSRVRAGEPLQGFDPARYSLAAPESTSEEEWTRALELAGANIEHQGIRQTNLDLLSSLGANHWRLHNYVLEADAARVEKELEQLQERVADVNRGRKAQQTQAGARLHALESRWTQLVSHTLQVEVANAALEAELGALRAREAGLRAELGL